MSAPLKPRPDNPSRSAPLPDHGPGFWGPLQSCGIDSGGEAWAALDQGVALRPLRHDGSGEEFLFVVEKGPAGGKKLPVKCKKAPC
jgi:hypothetical protein